MLHHNHSRCDITRIPYTEPASHFDSLPASLPVFEDSGPPHTALAIPRRRPPPLTIAANRTIDREGVQPKGLGEAMGRVRRPDNKGLAQSPQASRDAHRL
jgi:hypothetical protein